VMPVDSQNQPIDWLAFTEKWFLPRYGSAFCLGEDQLSQPCIFGEPLKVYRHPISWLRRGCDGIVVLRPEIAWRELDGVVIGAEDEVHRLNLKRLMVPPKPRVKILIPKRTVAV